MLNEVTAGRGVGEDPAGGNRLTKPNSGLTFSPPFPLPNLVAFGPPLMGYHGKTDGREVTGCGCILQTLFRQPCGAWTCNMAGAGGEQERSHRKGMAGELRMHFHFG